MPVSESSQSANPKPLLFDQARHSFGKIWLRPQVETDRPPKAKAEGRYLKLTFRLNDDPDLAVMNELALHLQFLPHVDQIRFEDLYAPKEQITNFMQLVLQAGKLRPLIRKIHAKRQLRKLTETEKGDNGVQSPPSLLKLKLDHKYHPAYDWSGASRVHDHSPKKSEQLRDQEKRSETWPPTQATSSVNGHPPDGQLSAEYRMNLPGPGTLVSTFVLPPEDKMHVLPQEQANGMHRPSLLSLRRRDYDDTYDIVGTVAHADTSTTYNENRAKRPRSRSTDR